MIFGKQNSEEISHKWFWTCLSYLKKCTSVHCEMQISCIWSKLHCFPQKCGCILSSQLFCHMATSVQTSNIAGIVKSVHFLCADIRFRLFLPTNNRIIHHVLLEYSPLWICWLSHEMRAQELDRIPHASWLLPQHTGLLDNFICSQGRDFSLVKKRQTQFHTLRNCLFAATNAEVDLTVENVLLSFTR